MKSGRRMVTPLFVTLAGALFIYSCLPARLSERARSEPSASIYHSPNHLALSADGTRVYVANQTAGTISVIDLPSQERVEEIEVGPFPTHIAVAPDGQALYVTSLYGASVDVVSLTEKRVVRSLATGFEPYGVALSASGEHIYVANVIPHTVSVIDVASGVAEMEIPVGRQPRFLVPTPDGRKLIVSNALSRYASIIDLERGCVIEERDLGRAGVARQIACSPDGRWVFLAHVVSHDELITLQMERGMIHSNGFSVLDLEKPGRRVTLLLDKLLQGAANPWGVVVSSDGKKLYVSLAGVHEVALVDLPRVLELMEGAGPDEIAAYAKDVELLDRAGIMRRVPSGGNGPRGIALSESMNQLVVANYFSDDVGVLDADSGTLLATIPLGPPRDMTNWRRGEMLFNDGRLCFQQWFSCASCHQEDAGVDGLSWDLANDGLGNPKNAKSLHDIYDTPPAMWAGVREDLDAAVAAGQRFLGFLPDPENHRALAEYIGSPRRAPNPYRNLPSKRLIEGERLFRRARCHTCHPAPTFTDLRKHDLGLATPSDLRSRFDTPSLREVYRTGPYLHDGRAETLREIFTEHNPQNWHGLTSALSDYEIDQLIDYVRSL